MMAKYRKHLGENLGLHYIYLLIVLVIIHVFLPPNSLITDTISIALRFFAIIYAAVAFFIADNYKKSQKEGNVKL